MKTFVKKLLLLSIVFVAANVLLFLCIQKESIGLSVEHAKIHMVENVQKKPKMIVSGGSNVGYSLDSELLTKQLNIESFNCSFSISHGYELLLSYISTHLKKGDIFLYIPEYDHYYTDNENLLSDALSASIYNNPTFFSHLSFAQKVDFIKQIPKINILLAYKNIKYLCKGKNNSSLRINARGDYIHHLDLTQTWEKSAITRYDKYHYDGKLSEHFKEFLCLAKEKAAEKGAFFYVSFPAIAASQYDERFKEDLEKFYRNTTIKIVGTPENYIFPDSLIYDHPYHTMRKGREMRTTILANDLQKVLTNH